MRRDKTNEDYFVGGRKMPWFPVGVSLFATAFSSLSFVALPREGAYGDYHLLVTYLCIPLVITPLLWWVFVPLYHRLGVTSVYEYLEIRYNRPMRRLGMIPLFALRDRLDGEHGLRRRHRAQSRFEPRPDPVHLDP